MGRKVIVVDDSKSVRQQLAIVLGEAGYNVVQAEDGSDGLDKVKGNRDASLMICDVNMPKMNGIELLEALTKEGITPGLPVVMLTTEDQPDLIARAKKNGAKGWIVKPFESSELIEAVKMLDGAP